MNHCLISEFRMFDKQCLIACFDVCIAHFFLYRHSGTSSISCSHRAGNGLLYPLERGFIFVHKPPVHIRFDEISCVNFARGSTTGRTFDFDVELKNGTTVSFSNLERYIAIYICLK